MKVLFPGTFNLWHNGHQQIYEEAKKSFGEVVVGVAQNPDKSEHDFDFIKWTLKPVVDNIVSFNGLTVQAAKKLECGAIVRGIRNLDDCTHEFKMADWNMNLGNIPTWFLYGNPNFSRLSSRDLRELNRNNVDISEYIPNEMVLNRWKKGKVPKQSIYFGRIGVGKSTYLKNFENVIDCDKTIWDFFTEYEKLYYGQCFLQDISRLHKNNYQDTLNEMDRKIDWAIALNEECLYEAPVLGNWWNLIPKNILSNFKLVKIDCQSEENRMSRCTNRGLTKGWVDKCDSFYKNPPFWDETVYV